jgi:hypothetical protein
MFLFIAVIGNISGKIETGTKARILSAVLGSAFIAIGLGMYWTSIPSFSDAEKSSPTVKIKPPVPKPQLSDRSTQSATEQIPEWVPIYPGANVEDLSIKERQGGGQYGSFSFRSKDDWTAVFPFYKANLTAQRWEVTQIGRGEPLNATNEGGSKSIVITVSCCWKYVITFYDYTN